MKIPNIFVPEKDFETKIRGLLEEKKIIYPLDAIKKGFEVIHALTFADGIAQLKWQEQKPLTLFDNIVARITDSEINGEYERLCKTSLDSVTGIAYKAHSTKFKIILRSYKLENIQQGFDQDFILVNYDAEQGIELDRKKDKYNQPLTREEAKSHEFWLAVMNDDKEKLAKYVDLMFKTGRKKRMGVYLRKNTKQEELFALSLGNDCYSSDIDGRLFFCSSVNFLSFAK